LIEYTRKVQHDQVFVTLSISCWIDTSLYFNSWDKEPSSINWSLIIRQSTYILIEYTRKSATWSSFCNFVYIKQNRHGSNILLLELMKLISERSKIFQTKISFLYHYYWSFDDWKYKISNTSSVVLRNPPWRGANMYHK